MYGSNIYFRYGQKVERRKVSNSKKMGRPKVDNPRKKRVEIRFNDEEIKHLDSLVAKYQMDRASIIRLALEKLK